MRPIEILARVGRTFGASIVTVASPEPAIATDKPVPIRLPLCTDRRELFRSRRPIATRLVIPHNVLDPTAQRTRPASLHCKALSQFARGHGSCTLSRMTKS